MAVIIPFLPILRERRQQMLQAWAMVHAAHVSSPEPVDYGWQVTESTPGGEPVRWFLPKNLAVIGYVPGNPDFVFLDYRHELQVFEMSIGELVAGIETGTLPEPYVLVDGPEVSQQG